MSAPAQQPSEQEEHRNEAAPRPAGRQYKFLLESLPAAAYTCDVDGLITSFNQRAVDVWGRAPLLNDPIDRYCGSFKLYETDGTRIEHDQSWMALALKNERAYLAKEIVVERPDGQRRTLLANATPFRDQEGRLLGSVNLIVDVNDRSLAEEQARRTSNTLTELVESSPIPMVIIDLKPGTVRLWNPAAEQLFGWRQEEVLGRVLPILSMETIADCRLHLTAASGDRVDWSSVRAQCRKDNAQIEVKMSSGALHDATGKVSGIALVFSEVTGHEQTEAGMEVANHTRNEFLATLAHELRNPLSPIRNAVQILHHQGSPTPQLEWALGVIDRQLGQMTRLIDDLIDVARITGSKLVLRRERIDLAEVIDLAVETSRPLFETCGHEFALAAPSQKLYIDGDSTRIAQVISNLLNNAAKYSGHGGHISLTAEPQGGEAVITVRDSGIGIPANMLPHVFEMFAHMEGSPDRLKGGLGIGLTLAKRLVEMHDGTITAHSEGPGKGSEFVVRLPIVTESPPSQNRRSPAVAYPVNGRSLRVLVVDDNEDSAASLSMLLRLLGYQIQTAHDGIEAIQMAGNFRPHAILLDIGLPKMNGYAVANSIRQQEWGEKIMMIATTGWGLDCDRQRSRDAGFDHHLVKPLDPEVVTQILSTVDPAAFEETGESWPLN